MVGFYGGGILYLGSDLHQIQGADRMIGTPDAPFSLDVSLHFETIREP